MVPCLPRPRRGTASSSHGRSITVPARGGHGDGRRSAARPSPARLAHREGCRCGQRQSANTGHWPQTPPRDADLAAVEDEQVRRAVHRSAQDRHELTLDLDGVVRARYEPVGDAQHVRIHRDASAMS